LRKSIKGRIKKLEKEVQTFRDNIDKMRRGEQ